MTDKTKPLVSTIKERCRSCYTCVRGCPAKAIRISGGQAEVLRDRCIGCGNCVISCGRQAKSVISGIEETLAILASKQKKAACLAPSFPAELGDVDPLRFAGMLKSAGFDFVTEVAFGADMVSLKYRELVNDNPDKKFISTACPAIVSYVEKFHPSLIGNLAPIVSPMVAQARIVKEFYGKDVRIVFIGPCIAKKSEAARNSADIDEAITFNELQEIFRIKGITPGNSLNAHFDRPYPAKGMFYPFGGGLLNSAEFDMDLMSGKFISVEGVENFQEALRNMETGQMPADFLDMLCCNGCLMGPGFSEKHSRYSKQSALRRYAKHNYHKLRLTKWEQDIRKARTLDYATSFAEDDRRLETPPDTELASILRDLGKTSREDELNCGACGYPTCIAHATAIYKGLAENEMCLPYTIERLKVTAKELATSYAQLSKTKQALLHSEKLAGMGQLAAGVAHELNNPLGVVLLYAHLLKDSVPGNSPILTDIKMISDQADRCKKIVGGLLNFARKNKPFFKPTDIHKLIEDYLKSAIVPPNVKISLDILRQPMMLDIDSDQIIQVLSNLVTNAIEAMPNGGEIKIKTFRESRKAGFSVSDTGCGIKEHHRKKVFEPFFTTKQIGKGTGLGLAVSYGIIKVHRGAINMETNTDIQKGPTGTSFAVSLPLQHEDIKS